MENTNRIPVNNGMFKRIAPATDAVIIYTENESGEILETEKISGADFITLLNWYHYQKENNKPIFPTL